MTRAVGYELRKQLTCWEAGNVLVAHTSGPFGAIRWRPSLTTSCGAQQMREKRDNSQQHGQWQAIIKASQRAHTSTPFNISRDPSSLLMQNVHSPAVGIERNLQAALHARPRHYGCHKQPHPSKRVAYRSNSPPETAFRPPIAALSTAA